MSLDKIYNGVITQVNSWYPPKLLHLSLSEIGIKELSGNEQCIGHRGLIWPPSVQSLGIATHRTVPIASHHAR
jgi:hypothetical protein